ncbi:MAG: class II glutamine amidotransferase [Paracoccaceae bacterium]
MCRLVAYLGPPRPLAEIIIEPSHSLLEQSQHATEAKITVQGDGFGVAWYDQTRGPGLYRDVMPAWSDGNLPSLCRMIRSDLFLAHVRASTSGEVSRVNCHPFQFGAWTFMHNGQIPDIAEVRRDLESTLPDPLYAARRGTTDSELVFLLLLAHGLQDDPEMAVDRTLAQLRTTCQWGKGAAAARLTCVLSDGYRLFALRASSDGQAPTLYQQKRADGALILASEPLDDDPSHWTPLPEGSFAAFRPQEEAAVQTSRGTLLSAATPTITALEA